MPTHTPGAPGRELDEELDRLRRIALSGGGARGEREEDADRRAERVAGFGGEADHVATPWWGIAGDDTGVHLRSEGAGATLTASVCTGVFVLAAAGLVTNHRVTTHWEDLADPRRQWPLLDVVDGVRWVEDGRVFSSAGLSAGIDLSLHLVARLSCPELAERTARQMDYRWMSRPD